MVVPDQQDQPVARAAAALPRPCLRHCQLLPDTGWTQNWLAQQSCRMGRYSLEVFCFGVLLAPLADMLNSLGGDALAIQVFSAVLGVGLMALLGAWLDFNKRLNRPVQVAAV